VKASVNRKSLADLTVAFRNSSKSKGVKVRLAVQTTVPGSLHAFFKGQLAWLALHDLQVHALSTPGEELNWVSDVQKVMTHAVPMTRRFSPFRDLIALWRLVCIYRKFRFTIVHAFTPKAGFLGMLAATIARCPVRLFTIWGLSAEPVSWRVRLMFLADKISCALAHKVFVECPSIAELAMAKGLCRRNKLIVLPAWSISSLDGNLTDLTDLAEIRATTRREWGLPSEAIVLGFVGRVVRDKGVHELVEAFEMLAPEFPELRLLIVGPRESEDPVDADMIRRMDQHVRIHSTGSQRDVRRLLSAMDVLVHPSYREGLPTAPLEAAARGLPVIATRIPGCIDAVQEGFSGLLVTPRDSRQLAQVIRYYLNKPDIRRAHGQNGREWVLRDYDRHKIWTSLLDEYKQILAERGIVCKI
jgi:glycosyltransferase involved in cell wall biosynthesis